MEQQESSSTNNPLTTDPSNQSDPQEKLAWLMRYSVVLAIFFPALGVWVVIWGPIQQTWAVFIPLVLLSIPMAWVGYTIHHTRRIVNSVKGEMKEIAVRVAGLEKPGS